MDNMMNGSDLATTATDSMSATALLNLDGEALPSVDEDALLKDLMNEWFSSGNLDLLPMEEGGEAPPDQPEEYQQRVTSRVETASIDEQDYEEGPQRYAFELIKDNCRDAYVKSVKDKARYKAIEWMFIPNHDDISFDICCQALGARPNLIRIRLMYQFFRGWLVFPAPLPFTAVGLPEVICGEILYDEGEDGLMLAKRIWSWPSITIARVEEFAKERKIKDWVAILERMDEKGMIANRTGNLYFTGRNPSEMSTVKRNSFNWTRIAI